MTTLAERRNEQIGRMWDVLLQVWGIITVATMDAALTVGALAAAASIYFTFWPHLFPWAMFTTGSIYCVLMLLRITRRFQERGPEHHDINEVGETLLAMDHQMSKRLNMICRNVVGPSACEDEDEEVLVELAHDV